MSFTKHDQGKPQLSWLADFTPQLGEVIEVIQFGAAKYSRNNWKQCEDLQRYHDAALRHLMASASGEPNDPETGLDHLAHTITNCLFLMSLQQKQE